MQASQTERQGTISPKGKHRCLRAAERNQRTLCSNVKFAMGTPALDKCLPWSAKWRGRQQRLERNCLGSRGGVAATGVFFRNLGSVFGLLQFENKVSAPFRIYLTFPNPPRLNIDTRHMAGNGHTEEKYERTNRSYNQKIPARVPRQWSTLGGRDGSGPCASLRRKFV